MTRPNVLLVTVDSLRADHVAACDPESPVETPSMDAVGHAGDGTTFTDAVAQGPFTTFSMPSLFTARYPSALRYVEFSENVVGVYPPSDAVTLPERLRAAGYRTGGFHSNPLLSNLFDFDRGFEAFEADLPFAGLDLPGRWKLLTNKLRRFVRKHAYLPAATVTDRAVQWVETRDEGPTFCWTHYMDVHGPYQRKSGFTYRQKYRAERLWQTAVRSPESLSEGQRTELEAAYREEVAYTDEHVGRLIEAVRAATDRPTIVVLTADHGDAFGEHGYYGHPHEVHDPVTNVPLLIDDPTGTVPAGVVDAPTELLDVAPTILAAAGVDVPDSFEGSVLGREAGANGGDGTADEAGGSDDVAKETDGADAAPPVVTEAELAPAVRVAASTDRWKLVRDEVADSRYLLDRDAGEEADRSAAPGAFDRLDDALSSHLDRPAATETTATNGEIDDGEVAERLRTLGYME